MAKSMNDRLNELQERCETLAKRNAKLEQVADQALSFIDERTPGQQLPIKNELSQALSANKTN